MALHWKNDRFNVPPFPLSDGAVGDARREFVKRARERTTFIEQLARALGAATERGALLAQIAREARTLRAGASAFGFSMLSEAAADLERVANEGTGGLDPGDPLAVAVAMLLYEAQVAS